MDNIMTTDELAIMTNWLSQGKKVALATVVKTWGSSPRAVGSHLVIDEQGNFEGSVSGGCIEGAVITEAIDIIAEASSGRLLNFGVSDEEAWEVGLSCGGSIQIYVEPVS
jgi:xanthine/CO dehydrogenase XdhC/CoxF family maturation factor